MLKDDVRLKPSYAERFAAGLLIGIYVMTVAVMPEAKAVVEENAEQLNPFKLADLEEFQEKLTKEEEAEQTAQSAETLAKMKSLDQAKVQAEQQGDTLTKSEIEELRKKLIGIKKKDRFRFGLDGDHTYNSNNNGATPHHEKDDNQFNAGGNVQYNFGGKKTDLGLEVRGTKNWNLINSTNDSWQGEERLRSRRRFFKKMNTSANSRIARNSSKTLEIESNKIRWDAANQASVNYAFSPKLALNLDLSSQKRMFLQEAFDQDSGWQAGYNPSGFWNVTPKSRISFGYGFSVSRNRLKAGDTNSHDLKIGYFGQVTKKSSASVDLSYSRQISQKTTSTTGSVTVGSGYVWQTTPKVQTSVQVTRGFSNTTSESVSGDTTDTAVVTKTDNYAVNDNVALSFNYRMLTKLTWSLTGGASHSSTKTFIDSQKDSQTRIFTFPATLGFSLVLTNWLTLGFRYSFSYKTGDSNADESRVHTWNSTASISF